MGKEQKQNLDWKTNNNNKNPTKTTTSKNHKQTNKKETQNPHKEKLYMFILLKTASQKNTHQQLFQSD